MKKTVLTYGVVAGLMVSLFMIVTLSTGLMNHGESAMIIGYLGMFVAFTFIFVAVKNYRDKQNGGVVSFGKALSIGLLIALIGSTFYVVTWLIAYNYFVPDFMDKYMASSIEALKSSGLSQSEIAAQTAEMKNMAELYKNPLVTAAFTYIEILPVGILMSLIAALALKRKPQLAI